MYPRLTVFLLALLALHFSPCMGAPVRDSIELHADLPVTDKSGNIVLDVFYVSDTIHTGDLHFVLVKQNAGDSLIVLEKRLKTKFKSGVNKLRFNLSTSDSDTHSVSEFCQILKKTGALPPGSYRAYLTATIGNKRSQQIYLHEVDSTLPPHSPLRDDVNASLAHKKGSAAAARLQKAKDVAARQAGVDKAFAKTTRKIDKAARRRGFSTTYTDGNGKRYINFFYEEWFAGRYEVNQKQNIESQTQAQGNHLQAPNSETPAAAEPGKPSVFSQYKQSNSRKKESEDVTGEIGFTTNISTGQEQYSGLDNNYYELRGRIEMPISGIPMQIEGMYTSQDATREIKASYFHIHYDIEKVKEKMARDIRSYNTKIAETKGKSAGLHQVYASSINNMEAQKAQLQNEVNAETASVGSAPKPIPQDHLKAEVMQQAKDTSGLQQSLSQSATDSTEAHTTSPPKKDSTAQKTAAQTKDAEKKVQEQQKRIDEKKKQIAQLEKKIDRLKTLLVQYDNTNRFDSMIAYDKTKQLSQQSDLTYKQMAKKSSALLPDGHAKGFIAGITRMDAGMFAKEESRYTMSGQMVKGLDVGYDLGICEVGVLVGKTQYIGRDGTLDKYTCYSEKTSFRLAQHQKVSLVYYGYTPDKMYYAGDAFFHNMSIAAPGFMQPVHIFSINYSGQISKYVTVGGEAATSIKKSDNTDAPAPAMNSKMSYETHVDGNIPNSPVTLQASYNYSGRNFENNTLPVSMSGTEQYKLGGRTDLLRSLLTLGIEYNRLLQNNFSGKNVSTRWGFDVRTNFKRYPNASISYKPFTTFRSYTDTLTIPQRPLLGSVWTGKASWQLKLREHSLRFIAIFNRSTTTMDTAQYGNDLAQLTTMYTDKVLTGSLTLGQSKVTGSSMALATSPNDMSFVNLSASYKLSRILTVSAGQDMGIAGFGFCKYGANAGMAYQLQRWPLTVRTSLRYSDYELAQGEDWKQIYIGNIDVLYKFKMKKERKNF